MEFQYRHNIPSCALHFDVSYLSLYARTIVASPCINGRQEQPAEERTVGAVEPRAIIGLCYQRAELDWRLCWASVHPRGGLQCILDLALVLPSPTSISECRSTLLQKKHVRDVQFPQYISLIVNPRSFLLGRVHRNEYASVRLRTYVPFTTNGFRVSCLEADTRTKSNISCDVSQVPPPYAHTPRDEDFYVHDPTGAIKPNVDLLKVHFFHEGRLTEQQALFILNEATALLSKEPNMLRISGPATGRRISFDGLS